MNTKNAKINNALYSVTTQEEYNSYPDLYDPTYTALECGDYVLPLIPKTSKEIGVIFKPGSLISVANLPQTDADKEKYSASNVKDYTKAKNMSELANQQACVRNLEREILTNVNNVFQPRISEEDTPEMKGFKQAVIRKGIDKAAYAPRLGPNAANDLRLFNNTEITLKKAKTIAKAFDMKITMVFEDASPDVPNPMGDPIVVEVTGGDSYDS